MPSSPSDNPTPNPAADRAAAGHHDLIGQPHDARRRAPSRTRRRSPPRSAQRTPRWAGSGRGSTGALRSSSAWPPPPGSRSRSRSSWMFWIAVGRFPADRGGPVPGHRDGPGRVLAGATRRLPRWSAVIVVLLVIVAAIAGFIAAAGPALVTQGEELVNAAPQLAAAGAGPQFVHRATQRQVPDTAEGRVVVVRIRFDHCRRASSAPGRPSSGRSPTS